MYTEAALDYEMRRYHTVKLWSKTLTARGLGCVTEEGNSMGSSGPSVSLSSLEMRPWTRGEWAWRLPSSCQCFSSSGMLSDAAVDRLEKNKNKHTCYFLLLYWQVQILRIVLPEALFPFMPKGFGFKRFCTFNGEFGSSFMLHYDSQFMQTNLDGLNQQLSNFKGNSVKTFSLNKISGVLCYIIVSVSIT